jgi:osmotically-inducible protein OsmY
MPTLLQLAVAALAGLMLSGCGAVVVGGVAATAAVAHDRRTAGTVVEDQEIEVKAIQLLTEHPEIKDQSNISVVSYNLQVLLTGQAASDDISRRFAELVSTLPRVRKVFNEVVTGAESTWSDGADDAYLTSKVKLALFDVAVEGFDPSRVKVKTSLDTVYLMGLLTPQEADAVTDKVRYVSGVKRVVRLFEYIPAT